MAISAASFKVHPSLPYHCPCTSFSRVVPIRCHSLSLDFPNYYGRLSEKAFVQKSTIFLASKTRSKTPIRPVRKVKYYISSDEDNDNLESAEFDDELENFFGGLSFEPLIPLMKAQDHCGFKAKITSIFENGLIHFRLLLVISFLLRVSLAPEVMEVVRLDEHVKTCLFNFLFNFCENDALEMKKNQEDCTNSENYDHVRAVGQFLLKKCNRDPSLVAMLQIFHASCTSCDINNFASVYLVKVAAGIVLKAMDDVIDGLSTLANETNAGMSALISHEGQGEEQEEQVIKTLGENLTKYAKRLEARKEKITWNLRRDEWLAIRKGEIIRTVTTTATFTSALRKLMRSLGICRDTRLPPDDHDYIEYLDKFFRSIIHFNNILIDFVKDMIQNISFFDLFFDFSDGDINIFDLENIEIGLGLANAEFGNSRRMLKVDLECQLRAFSTNTNFATNMGFGLSYSFFAYKDVASGIEKLVVSCGAPKKTPKNVNA